jgi:hypothetical protein
VAERGHLTNRYAKAIELLGDTDSIAILRGGIQPHEVIHRAPVHGASA